MRSKSSSIRKPAKDKVVPEGDALAPINSVLRKHFYNLDLQASRIVMGCAKAHYLKVGDPPWLFNIAPPGSGKTATGIMGASRLEQVHVLGDITEKTFLSGFYGHKDPGLLEKLGETQQNGDVSTTEGNGLLLIKDFTTVLSMKRDKRSEILAQLREIHDGEFRRDFGTGQTKIWRGRVTIIGAVTPAIDRHYSIFSTLGERFLQVRSHRPDSEEAGKRAIEQQGQEAIIRAELQRHVKDLFDKSSKEPPNLLPAAVSRIASLAEVIAFGRTHVDRNSYGNREIEYVPEPEANTRLSKGLAAIAKGLAALNLRSVVAEQDLQDVFRVGLDCLPINRRSLLLAVMTERDVTTLPIPRTIRDRQLEELKELKILEPDGATNDGWKLTKKAKRLLSTVDFRVI